MKELFHKVKSNPYLRNMVHIQVRKHKFVVLNVIPIKVT